MRSVRTDEDSAGQGRTDAGERRAADRDPDPATFGAHRAAGPSSTANGRRCRAGGSTCRSGWSAPRSSVPLFVAWALLSELALLLGLLAVALFFTIVLTPFVDRVQARLHVRRTVATLLVFVIGTAVVAGIVLLFVQPIASSSSDLGRDLPKLVRDAEHGRGRIGHVLRDLGVQGWVHDNLPAIRKSLGRSDGPLFQAGVAVVSGVVATITIMVLVFLMLVEGPIFSAAVLDLFPPTRAARIRRVGTDAARAMSGYAVGNLAISGLAGLSVYVALRLLGVPFALVFAVWVAFADLIPLVGATLGAIPPVFVGLLKSPGTAIAVIVVLRGVPAVREPRGPAPGDVAHRAPQPPRRAARGDRRGRARRHARRVARPPRRRGAEGRVRGRLAAPATARRGGPRPSTPRRSSIPMPRRAS